MMTVVSNRASASWIDLPEPLASLISEYQTDLRFLELAIIAGKPDNLKKIGHCLKDYKNRLKNCKTMRRGIEQNNVPTTFGNGMKMAIKRCNAARITL